MKKLTCANYIDFGKCQHKFGHSSWSKNDFNFFDRKFKVFKKDDNKHFWLKQNRSKGEPNFNHFIRLGIQLVILAKVFGGEQNLSPMQMPTRFEDMDEHLQLAHRVVVVVDCPNRKISQTILRYDVDKPVSS